MVSWSSARTIATAFPETEERDHFGSPSFRVRGKIFAQLSPQKSAEQRGLVKLSVADQKALTRLDADAFRAAPHWGRHGWTYIRLASIDESTFRDLIGKSWRTVAPQQLVVAHGEKDQSKPTPKRVRGSLGS
jgi:hypothetical protein